MPSLNLSENIKALAEARAAERGHSTVEEYVEELVRTDAGDAEEFDKDLERLLLERVDGPFVEMDASDFAQIRQKFQAYVDASDNLKP